MGIKTNHSNTFVINTKTRNEILNNCKNNEEKTIIENIIKPLLKGRNVKRYYSEWNNLWIIYINKNTNILKLPTLLNYICKSNNELSNLLQQNEKEFITKITKSLTFKIELEKEKIIFPDITQSSNFYIDTDNFYIDSTLTAIISKQNKYFCGLLNSNTIEYYLKNLCFISKLQHNSYRYKKIHIEEIHVPTINLNTIQTVKDIETIVGKIMEIKKVNKKANIENFEEEINYLVYKLYDLNEKEISLIKKNIR